MDEAYFVPVSVDKLADSMGSWENFIHGNYNDKLVQLAIIHAEFESIHPFTDGNGRLGRMCVPLYLFKSGLINSPMFYISEYFEANREEYYERLRAVSKNDGWLGWCQFFLKAVIEQAEKNQNKAKAIMKLYDEKKDELAQLTHSQHSIQVLDFIFQHPIFTSAVFRKTCNIPKSTAIRIFSVLKKSSILTTIQEPSGSRPGMYAFRELINTAEGKEVL